MSLYERSIAAGIPHDVALRDQHADDIQRFNVREMYAREQSDDGIDFRQGWQMKYGAALGAD